MDHPDINGTHSRFILKLSFPGVVGSQTAFMGGIWAPPFGHRSFIIHRALKIIFVHDYEILKDYRIVSKSKLPPIKKADHPNRLMQMFT